MRFVICAPSGVSAAPLREKKEGGKILMWVSEKVPMRARELERSLIKDTQTHTHTHTSTHTHRHKVHTHTHTHTHTNTHKHTEHKERTHTPRVDMRDGRKLGFVRIS